MSILSPESGLDSQEDKSLNFFCTAKCRCDYRLKLLDKVKVPFLYKIVSHRMWIDYKRISFWNYQTSRHFKVIHNLINISKLIRERSELKIIYCKSRKGFWKRNKTDVRLAAVDLFVMWYSRFFVNHSVSPKGSAQQQRSESAWRWPKINVALVVIELIRSR